MDCLTCPNCNQELQRKIWWTRKELAHREGMSPGTLAVWAVQGVGPKHVLLGRTAKYHIEDIEAWERSLRDGTTAA
jgi:hypothetical protein